MYLMLLNSSNFWIHGCNASARCACKTNPAGVAFKGSEDESCNLTIDVTSLFGVRECLVGHGLLEAVGILSNSFHEQNCK